MTQGELEKRIKIMVDEIKENYGGNFYLGAKDLFQSTHAILDEAKKDLPPIPENTAQKSDAQWLIELTGFRLQMRQWIDRWLGGRQPKK